MPEEITVREEAAPRAHEPVVGWQEPRKASFVRLRAQRASLLVCHGSPPEVSCGSTDDGPINLDRGLRRPRPSQLATGCMRWIRQPSDSGSLAEVHDRMVDNHDVVGIVFFQEHPEFHRSNRRRQQYLALAARGQRRIQTPVSRTRAEVSQTRCTPESPIQSPVHLRKLQAVGVIQRRLTWGMSTLKDRRCSLSHP